jgi:hypothetical protein
VSDYLSLGGNRAHTADVQIPLYGLWTADVALAEPPASLSGATALVIGSMTLAGYIYRGASFAGSYRARLVGGFGGWQATLPAQAYQNPGGIQASTLLQDAAATVGEQVNVVADYNVGAFYSREQAPAARLLRMLASTWWVDLAGVTQVQIARPTNTIQSSFQVIEYWPDKGMFEITTESPQDWAPGAVFSSVFTPTPTTVSAVRIHSKDSGELTLGVLAT